MPAIIYTHGRDIARIERNLTIARAHLRAGAGDGVITVEDIEIAATEVVEAHALLVQILTYYKGGADARPQPGT